MLEENGALGLPRVSVVMAVYTDIRFLDQAVESILSQTLTDFEYIIIDDWSDHTGVFADLKKRDKRIRIVTMSQNGGAAAAANAGVAIARAPIIARIDADDIYEPECLQKLVAAMDANPGLGIVGSTVTFMSENGELLRVQPMPPTDLDVRWTILFHNPFFHPGSAFRKALFDKVGGYRVKERISHDHYLWHDMLPHCMAINLAEPLLRYRINPMGLTVTNSGSNPRARTHAIREERWKTIGLPYEIYDNFLAADISSFLRRDRQIERGRRLAAYAVILRAMKAFLESHKREHGARDDAAARALTRRTLMRMFGEERVPSRQLPALIGLALALSPWETVAVFFRRKYR